MKRTLYGFAATTLVIFALGASRVEAASNAEAELIKPVTGLFRLRVTATFIPPPISPTDAVILLVGRGRAAAGRCVKVELGPLYCPMIPAKAEVAFEPLYRYGPNLRYFRGRGKAAVSVFGRTYTFRLAVHGVICRTPWGAMMTARFVPVLSSVRPPHFRGMFWGPKVREATEE